MEMSQKIDRKLEGAELEYAKGAILYHHNHGQGFDYFLIGGQCVIGIALTGITIKLVKMLFADFSMGLMLAVVFIGAFAAFIWWMSYILIFHSNRKVINRKIFANGMTAYDVALTKVRHGRKVGKYLSRVQYIDGSVTKFEILCHYYGIQPYKKGIIIKIMGDHDRPVIYDMIPEYVPESRVDRIARKELQKKKYNKYKREQ